MSNQTAWMIQMNWSEAAYAQTGEVFARDYGQKGELVPGLRETASNAMRSMIVELEASRPLSEVFNVEVIAQPGTIWDDRGFVGAPGDADERHRAGVSPERRNSQEHPRPEVDVPTVHSADR